MGIADRDAALALLREAVEAEGNNAVARRIGVNQSVVSQLCRGTYRARDPKLVLPRIVAALGVVECPHLGERLSHEQCRAYQARPMPTSDPDALAFWGACRRCPHFRGEPK